MTKTGYVCIPSNIGFFGEDVAKYGLPRRLELDDPVKELGDASAPLGLDTHAMIYSDEAPALESPPRKEARKGMARPSDELPELYNRASSHCRNYQKPTVYASQTDVGSASSF
ncbi:hypothetical protein O4H61_08105 [Roseovarius aestuarii]|nr:hypothetical protein [Roseovarius aestuarii]